jgi:molecular chaperone GrpE
VAAQHDPAFPGGDDQRRAAAGADTQDAAPPAEEAAPDAAAAIADLQARIGVLENEWRRALADADNVRKRCARDAERIRADEHAEAARQWLPVIDDLDRALEHAQADPGSIVGGVRAVRDEALRVLAGLGFPRRDDTGEVFDPARHDAVGSRPGGQAPPGTVVQVVRPAYGSGEQQLRPALVVVAAEDS